MIRSICNAYFRVCDSFYREGGEGKINNGIYTVERASRKHDVAFDRVEGIVKSWDKKGIM